MNKFDEPAKSILDEFDEIMPLVAEVSPIEDFSITIKSLDMAEICYTRNGKEYVQAIEIEVNHGSSQKATHDYPGCDAYAEIESAFGLSVEERHEWDKYLVEHDIEAMLLEFIDEEIACKAADYVDMVMQSEKDRKIEEIEDDK
jgi:hypothetical protein